MKKFNAFIVTLSVILCITYIVCMCKRISNPIETEIVYIDTVVVHDTVYYKQPIPVDSIVIKYVTKTLEVAPNVEKDTTALDSIEVNVPITQKEYNSPDYRIWISGYMTNLDSAYIYRKNQTLTISPIKTKQPRFSVGIQAGMGVSPEKFYPYIGVGISYNIFSW